MRLAHFSDIHLTLPPLSASGRLLGKRMVGALNYYAGGRGRHFHEAGHRIECLLDDVDAASVDHVLCTGDITQMAWRGEFEAAASLFGPRLDRPERFTVIPGNHDRYTRDAVQDDCFTRHFGRISAPTYPYVKRLARGALTLVLLDATRPTGLVDSSGWCGPERLGRLADILTDPSLDGTFVILAMHYGLLRSNGRPDRPRHGLRDHLELRTLIDRPEVRLDLVLHGHMHRPYVVRTERRTLACVGSATDLATGGGWHLFDIDLDRRRYCITRRVWSVCERAYVASRDPIPGWGAPGSWSEHLASDVTPGALG